MTIGLFPPPTPFENNPAWQEINKQLNVDFKMNIVAPGDYVAKLATVMAGNDMPDLLFFYYNLQTAITAVAGVPQFLDSQGADLTPYLAGDAIKDYPSLANIPTRAWKNSGSVFNDKIIMVPKPLYSEGFVFLKNVTQWDADIGKDYVPKNADDFKRVMQALTKPQEESLRDRLGRRVCRPATRSASSGTRSCSARRTCGGWRSDGKLTRNFETPEYKEAVAYVHDLLPVRAVSPQHAAVHERSECAHRLRRRASWTIWLDGFATAWSDPVAARPHVDQPVRSAHDPAVSSARRRQARALPERGAPRAPRRIKKSTPERTKELLRVLNYLAAPFGSTGRPAAVVRRRGARLHAGRQGQSGADRARQPRRELPAIQVHRAATVGAVPARHPRLHKVLVAAEKQLLPIGIADPTVGFVSPTAVRHGAVVDPDAAGRHPRHHRRPPPDWRLRPAGRASGAPAAGDQIRKEYQDAIAAAK